MKKRIIFDVDGTLIPNPDYRIAVKATFNDLGLEYTDADITNFIKAMVTYEEKHELYNYEYYLKHINLCVGKNFDKQVLENYLMHTERLIPHRPDLIIIDTLEYLIGQGYELGVLSNFFKEVQEDRLDKLDYLRYFSFVLGGEEFRKPNVKAYYEASKDMRKDNVIFIGDSRMLDYEVPKSLGFDALLYDPNCQSSTKQTINNFEYLRKVL